MFCINCTVAREYGTDYFALFWLLAGCIVEYICFVRCENRNSCESEKEKRSHHRYEYYVKKNNIYSRAFYFSCTGSKMCVFLSRVLPREC